MNYEAIFVLLGFLARDWCAGCLGDSQSRAEMPRAHDIKSKYYANSTRRTDKSDIRKDIWEIEKSSENCRGCAAGQNRNERDSVKRGITYR